MILLTSRSSSNRAWFASLASLNLRSSSSSVRDVLVGFETAMIEEGNLESLSTPAWIKILLYCIEFSLEYPAPSRLEFVGPGTDT